MPNRLGPVLADAFLLPSACLAGCSVVRRLSEIPTTYSPLSGCSACHGLAANADRTSSRPAGGARSHRKLKAIWKPAWKRAGKPQPTGRPGNKQGAASAAAGSWALWAKARDVAQTCPTRARSYWPRSVARAVRKASKNPSGPSRHRSAGNPGAATQRYRRTSRPTCQGQTTLKSPTYSGWKKKPTSSQTGHWTPGQRLPQGLRMLTPEGMLAELGSQALGQSY